MVLPERMNPSHSHPEPPDEGSSLPVLSASLSACPLSSSTTVCGNPVCQNQRRRDYHRQKIASDPVYQQVCLESPRKWRKATPDYWKNIARSTRNRWNEIADSSAYVTKSGGW